MRIVDAQKRKHCADGSIMLDHSVMIGKGQQLSVELTAEYIFTLWNEFPCTELFIFIQMSSIDGPEEMIAFMGMIHRCLWVYLLEFVACHCSQKESERHGRWHLTDFVERRHLPTLEFYYKCATMKTRTAVQVPCLYVLYLDEHRISYVPSVVDGDIRQTCPFLEFLEERLQSNNGARREVEDASTYLIVRIHSFHLITFVDFFLQLIISRAIVLSE